MRHQHCLQSLSAQETFGSMSEHRQDTESFVCGCGKDFTSRKVFLQHQRRQRETCMAKGVECPCDQAQSRIAVPSTHPRSIGHRARLLPMQGSGPAQVRDTDAGESTQFLDHMEETGDMMDSSDDQLVHEMHIWPTKQHVASILAFSPVYVSRRLFSSREGGMDVLQLPDSHIETRSGECERVVAEYRQACRGRVPLVESTEVSRTQAPAPKKDASGDERGAALNWTDELIAQVRESAELLFTQPAELDVLGFVTKYRLTQAQADGVTQLVNRVAAGAGQEGTQSVSYVQLKHRIMKKMPELLQCSHWTIEIAGLDGEAVPLS